MSDYDLTQATLYNTSDVVKSFPVTTTIQAIDVTSDGFNVRFDKKDSWPDVTPPGWAGPLEFTIGLVRTTDGAASAVIQCWRGDLPFGGPVSSATQIATNWFYDGRWGPLAHWQPQPSESVGLFVVAGNWRGATDRIIEERSNVPTVPWPAVGFLGRLPIGPPPPPPDTNPLKQRILALMTEAESLVRQL